jgi:chemotaxis protein methyltransferase CheR
MVAKNEIGNKELEEVLQIIMQYYGYDFRDYSVSSLKRRISRFMEVAAIKDVFELRYYLINNKEYFPYFLQNITVNVTEMFRDPEFYMDLRAMIIPVLSAYPIIKIWHAGCATGEEVFSMCIMLEEEGLLNRTQIYATDINPANLIKAKQGIIPLSLMKGYTQNYLSSGGKNDFSSYYTARYDNAVIDKSLTRNIIFSRHNLVTESSFNEFQLIICRNVLIYFNKSLQEKVFHLFYDSLAPKGFLAIGIKESLLFSGLRDKFETISSKCKIFKRKM